MQHFHFLDSTADLTKNDVGGKGFYLHQMAKQDLPIPQAAFLTTGMWREWRDHPAKVESELRTTVIPAIIEYLKANNNGVLPLVSVRSAGAVSMPGMMDTILNVGVSEKFLTSKAWLGDEVKSPAEQSEADGFAADTFARFLTMYGTTVLDMPKTAFEHDRVFKNIGEVQVHFEKIYKKHKQTLPSQDPAEQIFNCAMAVFRSWDNDRAKLYRKLNGIDENAGTAVVIQRMVFGNKNKLSASGVLFSRNPSTGVNELTGEYLVNAQGEDVVAGVRTPDDLKHLEDDIPGAYSILKRITEGLEARYRQMQDVEFTIEDGQVFILQARTAKCSPFAKLRMLIEMYKFNDISAQDVLDGLGMKDYLEMNIRQVDPAYAVRPDGEGLAASMGAIQGRVVFGPSRKYEGEPTIYCAKETTPDDLQAIQLATGILTATGGVTSHAAVVARGMGKVCVVGCSDMKVTKENGDDVAYFGNQRVVSGDWLTMDAGTGKVWVGRDAPILDAENSQIFADLQEASINATPGWTRMVSSVDDLYQGTRMWFLTYALESGDEEFLTKELDDAAEFLTGVMDLTGKLDYLQDRYPNQFLFADITAENAFLRKKEALINIARKGFDRTFNFEVYLGPYEEAHGAAFRGAGLKVLDKTTVSHDGKNPNATWVLTQDAKARIDPEKVVISSRNALLGTLK